MRIAVIIPAYNEAPRLPRVLAAVTAAAGVEEVIVVSDGSTDETFEVAAAWPGVTPVALPTNVGKAGALAAGVDCTPAEGLLFLDADLIGLTPAHVEALLQPLLDDTADMTVGRFNGLGSVLEGWPPRSSNGSGPWSAWREFGTGISLRVVRHVTHRWHHSGPNLSGQRALRRELFTGIPQVETLRFGIEAALTHQTRLSEARVQVVDLVGVTHTLKVEKFGWWRALVAMVRVCKEIGVYEVRRRWKGLRREASLLTVEP